MLSDVPLLPPPRPLPAPRKPFPAGNGILSPVEHFREQYT